MGSGQSLAYCVTSGGIAGSEEVGVVGEAVGGVVVGVVVVAVEVAGDVFVGVVDVEGDAVHAVIARATAASRLRNGTR